MIYIASKTKHAELWRFLRLVGWPISCTWIDESESGQTSDFNNLWNRCITEVKQAELLIIYKEPEDILKGAWIELGVALAEGIEVAAIGLEDFTIGKYNKIKHYASVVDALLDSGIERQ